MSPLPCERYGSREVHRVTHRVSIHEEDVTKRRFVVYEDIGRTFNDRRALNACEEALLVMMQAFTTLTAQSLRATEEIEARHRREVLEARIGELRGQACVCEDEEGEEPFECSRCKRLAALRSDLAALDAGEEAKP